MRPPPPTVRIAAPTCLMNWWRVRRVTREIELGEGYTTIPALPPLLLARRSSHGFPPLSQAFHFNVEDVEIPTHVVESRTFCEVFLAVFLIVPLVTSSIASYAIHLRAHFRAQIVHRRIRGPRRTLFGREYNRRGDPPKAYFPRMNTPLFLQSQRITLG